MKYKTIECRNTLKNSKSISNKSAKIYFKFLEAKNKPFFDIVKNNLNKRKNNTYSPFKPISDLKVNFSQLESVFGNNIPEIVSSNNLLTNFSAPSVN